MDMIPKRVFDGQRPGSRRGVAVPFFAIMLVVLLTFIAFAVDIGYICLVRTEMQLAADAGALAGANALYDVPNSLETTSYSINPTSNSARTMAQTAVQLNSAGRRKASSDTDKLIVEPNIANLPSGDIVLGRFTDPSNFAEQLRPDLINPNAVQVSVVMSDAHPNGALPLFFSRVFGMLSSDLRMTAIASSEFPTLLPIVTHEEHWNTLLSGGAGDNYNFSDGTVTAGSDGTPELVIFPGDWDGGDLPPGNFGLVNIGPNTGATVIREQIDLGPSASEMDHHGGTLNVGDILSGQTGVEATVETAFVGGTADSRTYDGIIGEIRYLPLYSDVTGQGTNSTFTLSKFVIVRIMSADLSSNPKSVVVQPVDSVDDVKGVKLSR
jgi:Flp pilus assembly protein TadG